MRALLAAGWMVAGAMAAAGIELEQGLRLGPAEVRWAGSMQPGGAVAVETKGPVKVAKWTVDGGVGITVRFWQAGGVWVLHGRCDRPGALGWRVTVEGGELEGRRLLKVGNGGRCWVFPMESDVTWTDGAIELLGEGEALVVVAENEAAARKIRGLGVRGDEVEDVADLLGKLEVARDEWAVGGR